MSTENAQTLDFYEQHAKEYEAASIPKIEKGSPYAEKLSVDFQNFLKESLKNTPKDGNIFEIGSGYGRDALYIRSLGYNLQTSDAADSFITRLKKSKLDPIKFNILTDDFPYQCDYVLAVCVLQHFTKSETEAIIAKIYNALKPGGIFTLSVRQKAGGKSEWKANIPGTNAKRYFSYWTTEEAKELYARSGYEILATERVGGAKSCWLEFILQKPEEKKQ